MIELVRDLRAINVLAKFENDPWKIVDVRVLTGLVCPAARPLGRRQYPGALKGCGVKTVYLTGIVHLREYLHVHIYFEALNHCPHSPYIASSQTAICVSKSQWVSRGRVDGNANILSHPVGNNILRLGVT